MTQFANPTFASLLKRAFVADDAAAEAKTAEAANVETVERLYSAIIEGRDLAEVCSQDVVFEIVGPPGVPMAGRHEGLAAMKAAAHANFALLQEQHPVVQTVVAQGDEVVVFLQEDGRLRATGRAYAMPVVQHVTIRDGQIVSFRGYCDNAVLLEAAGQWERTG